MSARFKNDGSIKVEAGIKKVFVELTIKWNDATTAGFALVKAFMNQENKEFNWERSYGNEVGSAKRNFQLFANPDSGKEWSISYVKAVFESGTLVEKSTSPSGTSGDKEIYFYDSDGNDKNVVITMKTSDAERYTTAEVPPPPTETPTDTTTLVGPSSCPAPTPWESLLPTCGSPPSGLSSSDGVQISKTGQNQITLNLKNYPNQLVSLKITHSTSADWTQSFGFNIPNCSDISPNTGGSPYSKSAYSNSNISGTNTFYVYNIDGGDYNYVFNHDSVPGPRPTRINYNLVCTTSSSTNESGGTDTVTTCVCNPFTETWGGAWPYCPTGVAVSKNGGSKVQWQYEDGGGGNYDDQYVTVEVISVRNAIGNTGAICTSSLKNNVWISDSTQAGAVGNCIGDYRDHSDKIRFRIPSLKISKTSLPDPVCYSAFRGISGAAAPGEELGTLSSQYSVLHIFDDDFNTTTSLVQGNGIIVTPENLTDDYHSPFGESNPSSNANLGTLDRKYYTVQFTDGTTVSPGASNISIFTGQDITASGVNADISVFKKEQAGANSLRVWFYISHEEDTSATDDIIHVFDDDANTTNTELSDLSSGDITITPQSVTDPGNGTVGYETLDDIGKKHYLITFSDSTIVETDGENINIEINQRKTASGVTAPISVTKKERVDDKNLRVWFTAYYSDRPAGLEEDNSFARDWSVQRVRQTNYSGNIFARSWYLSKDI